MKHLKIYRNKICYSIENTPITDYFIEPVFECVQKLSIYVIRVCIAIDFFLCIWRCKNPETTHKHTKLELILREKWLNQNPNYYEIGFNCLFICWACFLSLILSCLVFNSLFKLKSLFFFFSFSAFSFFLFAMKIKSFKN